MSSPEPEKKRRGCFYYGCITVAALFVLVVAIIGFTGWYTVHWVNGLIAEYTDTAPVPLPKVDMPADEMARLKARVAEFKHALDAHTNTPPLILTSREINALMADSPNLKQMNLDGVFYVDLEGDQIKGQLSLPLERLPKMPFIKTAGRYLNGDGDFLAAVSNGTLTVSVKSLEVRGKPLPAQVMTSLQQQNLAQAVNQNPTNTAMMSRFESVEVKDGTLILNAKSP